jgi:hypothetical protein
MRRSELVEQMKSEQESFEGLLGQVGEERMEEPGVAGEWSMKDVVAHLTAWRRRTVARIEAAAQGKPEPAHEWPEELKEDDDVNAWFHERDRNKSVSQVLAESRRVFDQLVAAVEKFPEDAVDRIQTLPWWQGAPVNGAAFFGHFHDEHEADMRAFASRQPTRS